MTSEKKFTYADLEQLPEGAGYQVVHGFLVHEPTPSTSHQRVAGELYSALRAYVRMHSLGTVWFAPLDILLRNDEVFQPDVFFISNSRKAISEGNKIEGAPDLVIEILSPSTAAYDQNYKKEVYAEA